MPSSSEEPAEVTPPGTESTAGLRHGKMPAGLVPVVLEPALSAAFDFLITIVLLFAPGLAAGLATALGTCFFSTLPHCDWKHAMANAKGFRGACDIQRADTEHALAAYMTGGRKKQGWTWERELGKHRDLLLDNLPAAIPTWQGRALLFQTWSLVLYHPLAPLRASAILLAGGVRHFGGPVRLRDLLCGLRRLGHHSAELEAGIALPQHRGSLEHQASPSLVQAPPLGTLPNLQLPAPAKRAPPGPRGLPSLCSGCWGLCKIHRNALHAPSRGRLYHSKPRRHVTNSAHVVRYLSGD